MKKTLILLAVLSTANICLNAQNANLMLRDIADYQVDLSDIWGYSDGQNEYALVGLMNAFTVVDVTDPDNIVKLFQATVDGPVTFWRDVKTYGHYAYGVHDGPFSGQSQGMAIMDLQYLPDSMPATFWTANGSFTEAHNIYIDEHGIAYLAGHNYGNSGVLMVDIASDPLNPVIVGQYADGYVHDCYVRNDTLWTSDGSSSGGGSGQKRFSIVDVSDKANPILLGYGATPGGYSHNIWVSDDGRTAYTTDDSSGAYVAAHDVTDPSDITEIDRYRSNPGSNVIPHNVMVHNDFLVVSYYRDGVILLDASLPDELVEVGRYDTAPQLWGSGFNGCWGVYPYLPSGNILAADIERGVHVLTPDYKRAVHIRGTVSDAQSAAAIAGADIVITKLADTTALSTDLDGKFRKGYADEGMFTITVSKAGYTTYSSTRTLAHGDVLDLDVRLTSGNYIGNFAWDDLNEDGIQDPGEPGIEGVEVLLLPDSQSAVASVWTGPDGLYEFRDIPAGNYRLQFKPPADGITRYMATITDNGDDELDSDIAKVDNAYKTAVISLDVSGSYLDIDGGFFKRPQTDPVDTIHIELNTGESVTVCDEAFENGLVDPSSSAVCAENGDLAGSSYNTNTAGCLSFQAGELATGPVLICVVTDEAGSAALDTTIFEIMVSDAVSAASDEFEIGGLTLLQNPVSSTLYLRNGLADRRALRIMISDMSGRELMRRHDDGFNGLVSLRVGTLQRGMYILAVYTETQLLGVRRFIKH
jgi:choice-of-anchor B domain-containing protein